MCGSSIKTVPELIAAAKTASEPIVFSTSGVGTGQHLAFPALP
jgi:tripartite-type tricarboxylate transporter receptor subunit TctC